MTYSRCKCSEVFRAVVTICFAHGAQTVFQSLYNVPFSPCHDSMQCLMQPSLVAWSTGPRIPRATKPQDALVPYTKWRSIVCNLCHPPVYCKPPEDHLDCHSANAV